MASTPRRKAVSSPRYSLAFTIFLLCLFVQQAFALSAVLGIDLGTEYIKAALVKPGIPLEIVLTKDSKRKESSAIAFKPSSLGVKDENPFPERLYGGDALALAPRFPGDVYPNLKPLLGSVLDAASAIPVYQQRYPSVSLINDKISGSLGFQSKTLPANDAYLSVEELLAMELTNIRTNAETMAGKGQTVRDVVITIPPFYTVDERRAVELAAELAGMRVLGLISDGLAVGLNYATPRTFPNVDKGENPEYHLVYDMGAGSTTATVLKLQARIVKDVGKYNKTIQEVNVIGTGWDRSLGGDALNQYIVDDMIAQFIQTSAAKTANIQPEVVKAHGRTMAKLWKEAERLRQVLSANSASSAFFEGLYEDIDFRYKLSRANFEILSEPFMDRVGQPLSMAMASTELQITDLNSIVMHGGAVRTPMIQRQLEKFAGDSAKLRSNVNADESAVFGAAFKAAGFSPSFRVKDIKSNDNANYVTTLQWKAGGKIRRQNIFVPTSVVGAIKTMQFNTSEDLVLSFSQQVPQSGSSELVERPIGTFKMTNLTASQNELTKNYGCDSQSIETVLSLRLSPITGLPEIFSGTVSCEGSEKKGGVVDGFKDFLGFGNKKDQEPLELEIEEKITASPSESASTSDTGSSGAESSSKAKTKSKKQEAKKSSKKNIQTIQLSVESIRNDQRQLPKDSLATMKTRLAAFDKSDQGRRLREELFNGLEGFTYKARDMLTDEGFIAVSTSKQRDAIESQLKHLSEWLHEDGTYATRDVIKEKLQSLKGLVDPIQTRKDETTKLPTAVQTLRDVLNQTSMMMSVVQNQIEIAAEAESSWSASSSSSSLSAAEEASSSPSATLSSSTDDDIDDLDDFEDSSTTSSPAASSTGTTYSSNFDVSSYTQADLETLTSAYEAVTAWLAESSAAQKALQASDDPVLLSTEVETRTEQLNNLLMSLLQKGAYRPPKSRSSSSTTSSKSKSKNKTKSKSKTKTGKGAKASSSPAVEGGESLDTETFLTVSVPDAASSGTAGASGHEEL